MSAPNGSLMALGMQFEREIYEQPEVWERIAASDRAARLADALESETIFVGSGSSLFAAQLGALALRRRGITAHALAATEARSDHRAYLDKTVVAISQSGRSSDVLAALDALSPRRVIALTNTAQSPLAQRSDVTVEIGAGVERAIPASKSVTATVAILLTAASRIGGDDERTPAALTQTAATVGAWLRDERASVEPAARDLARCKDIAILGTDYGVPVAREAALKFKEATYLHAEGFEAGEFRHGSAAMVEATSAVIGIVDEDGKPVVERPMREAQKTGAMRLVIGTVGIDDVRRLGPVVAAPYNTLAWLVAVQMLVLHVARERGIDSDAPRGLTKAVTR